MTEEILGKVIESLANVIASVITVSGLWVIARHRKNVIKLAMNVESYHKLEHALLREKLVAEGIYNPTEGQIRHLKGQTRTRVLGEDNEKLLSQKEAMQLRKNYFG